MSDGVGVADARVSTTVAIAASVGVSVMGFFQLPDLSFTADVVALVPVLVGVVGYLLVALVVEPLSRPKRSPDTRTVIRWLGRTVKSRVLVLAFSSPAGFVVAATAESRTPLVFGVLSSLALGVLWWPGRKCFERLLSAIEPVAGERVVTEVRAKNKGRIIVLGRATGTFDG